MNNKTNCHKTRFSLLLFLMGTLFSFATEDFDPFEPINQDPGNVSIPNWGFLVILGLCYALFYFYKLQNRVTK